MSQSKRWVISWLISFVAVACTDPFPPVLFESKALRSPIGVNDSALYYVTSPNYYDSYLAQMSLDGVPRGFVTDEQVDEMAVRGSRIEWLEGPWGAQRIVRSIPTGMETAALPLGPVYDDLHFSPTATFVMGNEDNTTSSIAMWGPDGMERLPLEWPFSDGVNLVGADPTHVYVHQQVDYPRGLLLRYSLAGGSGELIASDVVNAVVANDKLVYATTTNLVERSLVDGSEQVLSTRATYGQIVVAGDVVFWGNQRVMDGRSEDFLLPPSAGYLAAVAVNSTDVYWLSSMRSMVLLLGEPGDYKLHQAPIRGERPF